MIESAENLLVGEHVKLWPYVRESYRPDVLHTLWRAIEDEQAWPLLFHAAPAMAQRGDLGDVVAYFNNPSVVLLLVESQASGDLAGAVWFDDVIPNFRAFGSVFLRRRHWGQPAREASRLALRYAWDVLGLQSVWATSPWPMAVAHAKAVGFQEVAVLPGLTGTRDQPLDVTMLKIMRQTHG